MLLTEPFFKTFTKKEIADASRSTETMLALSTDTRQEVDELADKALAAGGTQANDPQDHGFMYSRSFYDLDGHHWEVVYMDPSSVQS
jgi:predicted lactoylglutathione lyase